MFERVPSLPSINASAVRRASAISRGILVLLVIAGIFAAGVARAADKLPLPRFATTRSTPINVRVGPGTRYDIAWVYVKAGTPVEIVQEFDTWRKIRDVDGSEGWVHQNLLSGKRAGIAVPWQQEGQVPLLSRRGDTDNVRAWLTPGFRVEISACDGAWCEVEANSPAGSYSGYLQQSELWGVYEGEAFD